MLFRSPEQLADMLDDWSAVGACDGFNLMFPVQSEGLPAFVDEVMPILRKRGLTRQNYEDTTLRGHLGLSRP